MFYVNCFKIFERLSRICCLCGLSFYCRIFNFSLKAYASFGIFFEVCKLFFCTSETKRCLFGFPAMFLNIFCILYIFVICEISEFIGVHLPRYTSFSFLQNLQIFFETSCSFSAFFRTAHSFFNRIDFY